MALFRRFVNLCTGTTTRGAIDLSRSPEPKPLSPSEVTLLYAGRLGPQEQILDACQCAGRMLGETASGASLPPPSSSTLPNFCDAPPAAQAEPLCAWHVLLVCRKDRPTELALLVFNAGGGDTLISRYLEGAPLFATRAPPPTYCLPLAEGLQVRSEAPKPLRSEADHGLSSPPLDADEFKITEAGRRWLELRWTDPLVEVKGAKVDRMLRLRAEQGSFVDRVEAAVTMATERGQRFAPAPAREEYEWVWKYGPLAMAAEAKGAPREPPARSETEGFRLGGDATGLFVTLNVAGEAPTEELPGGPLNFLVASSENPELVCLGLQEAMPLTAKNVILGGADADSRLEQWLAALDTCMKGYRRVKEVAQVGLLLVAFVRDDAAGRVGEVVALEMKTGVMGLTGNKGAVGVSLQLDGTEICVINVHLSSGDGAAEAQARRGELAQIIRDATFDGIHCMEHHHLFILGDFNSRSSQHPDPAGHGSVRTLALSSPARRKEEAGLAVDELTARKRRDGEWFLFGEGVVGFQPTYKTVPGRGGLEYSEKRFPSWTDRVLYRSKLGADIRAYDSIPEIDMADHSPVYCLADLRLA